MTQNDELASQVGQDKPTKELVTAYDQKHGAYSDKLPELRNRRDMSPAESTVSPFVLK